jgi:hypothetical protein
MPRAPLSASTCAAAAPLLVVLLAALPAAGQSIQRCEGQGRVTYANGPCPDGTTAVREVNTAPPVAVSDQKAARERATRESKQLERLQRDRQAEENKAEKARASAARKEEARVRDCRKLAARVDAARDAAGSATLARRTETERALRRLQDQYARECGS